MSANTNRDKERGRTPAAPPRSSHDRRLNPGNGAGPAPMTALSAGKAMTSKAQQLRRERILSIVSPIAMVVLWELLVRSALLDIRFIPPPSGIVGTFVEMGRSGELWSALSISLFRIFVGFIVGAVPAMLLGLTMGLFPLVRAALDPIVAAFYPIPKLALLPLIMLVFGIGEAGKVATIAIGVFFLVLINTVAGVINIDKIYLDVARNYGASKRDYYLTIALPGAMPLIFTGLKLGMGMALLLIVAAEMIGAKSGIGYMIWTGYQTFYMEKMFVGLTIMAVLGYGFSVSLDEIERKVLPWKQ